MELWVGKGGGDAANGGCVLSDACGIGIEGDNPRGGCALPDEGGLAVSSGRSFRKLFQLQEGEINGFLLGGLGMPQGEHRRTPIDVETRWDGRIEPVAELDGFGCKLGAFSQALRIGCAEILIGFHFPKRAQGCHGTARGPVVGFCVKERHAVLADCALRECLRADRSSELRPIVALPLRVAGECCEDLQGEQHARDVVKVVSGKASARSKWLLGWHAPEVGDEGLDGVGETAGDFHLFVRRSDTRVQVLPEAEKPRERLVIGAHGEV